MTPEICTHCGQPMGMAEELERTKQFENDESRRRQELYSALVRIATSLNYFDAVKIAKTALDKNEKGGREKMNEHISDLLIKIANILHFFKLYGESKRIMELSVWLRSQEVPEDI